MCHGLYDVRVKKKKKKNVCMNPQTQTGFHRPAALLAVLEGQILTSKVDWLYVWQMLPTQCPPAGFCTQF